MMLFGRMTSLHPSKAHNTTTKFEDQHHNNNSFLFDSASKQAASVDEPSMKPKIQVNGEDSIDETFPPAVQSELVFQICPPSLIILKGCSGNAAERRLKFVNSSTKLAIRSLEENTDGSMEVTMKPLKDRARSLSPLKQLRTYSFRSTPSEESFLSEMVWPFFFFDGRQVSKQPAYRKYACSYLQQQRCIRRSWCSVTQRLSTEKHEFGFFVFLRVFSRAPQLKRAFGAEKYDCIEDIPHDHPVHRYSHIFTKVIDLAVRNVDEVENEIAPAIFRYGQRHYHSKAREQFGEESVRLFCSQVVCAVVDFADMDDDEPLCVEAWVELMRYIGAKLLDGFQFEHLANTKKLAINTNDHVFFIL
ncbi:unnamed protein product [Toxocara canis]|uniref:GLOBIN domain-containing protein n=1 Tax=Toxocara canis TaxID=6265 RepID=A0A183V3C1_TOXCA|nr:unnamed protein product [Toxocara canis]